MKTLTVNKNEADLRLDSFLTKLFPKAPKSLIYKWIRKKRVKVGGKKQNGDYRLKEGDELSLFGVEITAYGSTDEGVSFLVRMGGWTLFHAGDLNFWHWREESSFKEIAQAEADFHAEVAPLIGREIDFAMFPLDPRMGEMYDAGAQYFLIEVRPKVLIPMHWWGRAEAALEFARRNRSKHSEIIALTRPGESLRAERGADGEIDITLP